MVDDQAVDPDYFIDRPPSAVFVPDSPGHDKTTVLNDRQDPHLFDVKLELQPILQVLVGKSLELARIEVIEEHEAKLLKKHI